jgi:hypothetical protein
MKVGNNTISMCGIRVCLTAVVAIVVMICPSLAQSQDAYWSGGVGDWFSSANWLSNDLPDLNQSAFMNNNGTAIISGSTAAVRDFYLGYSSGDGNLSITSGSFIGRSMQIAEGSGSAGTVVQTGGMVDLNGGIRMGRNQGFGSYTISDGVLEMGEARFGSGQNSTAAFNMNGGTVLIKNGGAELGWGGGSNTTFVQTDGSLTVTGRLRVGNGGSQGASWSQSGGTAVHLHNDGIEVKRNANFDLGGTGELTARRLRIDEGLFAQSGGVFNVNGSDGVEIYNNGQFQLTGAGQLATTGLTVDAGRFTHSSGTVNANALTVAAGGRYEYSGGSLNISDSWVVDGIFDFGGSSTVLETGPNAIVNLSSGLILQSSLASVNIMGLDSFVVLAPGQAEGFYSFVNEGTTHLAGSALHIPSGRTQRLGGAFADPVIVEGTLLGLSGQSLSLIGGLTVSGAGSVSAGLETLALEGVCDMDGQSISAYAITLAGRVGSSVAFSSSSGSVTSSNDIGIARAENADSVVTINGGSVTARSMQIAEGSGSAGTVVQTGGMVDLNGGIRMGRNQGFGSYTISDGVLEMGEARFGSGQNSTAAFNMNGGTVLIKNGGAELGWGGGSNTTFVQTDGSLTVTGRLRVGNGGSQGASWSQSGGTATVQHNDGIEVKDHASFDLAGTGELTATRLRVDGGRFTQDGGAFEASEADGVYVYGNGRLEIGGSSQFRTTNLAIGQNIPQNADGAGSLAISNAAADVSISGTLSFGPQGSFTAVPGASIHFTGSALNNLSTSETALSGLENTTLVFEGGVQHWSTLEAAGRDIGLQPAGFENNFAIDHLVIGGAANANLRLQDIVNNGNRSSSEALYAHDVTLAAGSTLDMNNLNLYFDGTFTDYGGTIINGQPTPGTELVPVKTVNAEDVSGTFTPVGGSFGLGQLTIADQANVVIGRDLGQLTYGGGSFSLTASLQADLSDGGTAEGLFGDGEISFRDAADRELLGGRLLELTLREVGDEQGMLAGIGVFKVTGGKFQDAFGKVYGDLFQMIFQIDPAAFDDFSESFSGSTNITTAPVPEPGTLGLLAIGGLAVLRRKRRTGAKRAGRNKTDVCKARLSAAPIVVLIAAIFAPAICFGGLGPWPGYDSADLGRKIIVPDDADYVVARYYGDWGGSPFELYLDDPSNAFGMLFDKTDPFGTEVNLGAFSSGDELVFRTRRNGTDTYYSGPASRNYDNTVHAVAIPQSYGYLVGWEGLPYGGDRDYADFVMQVDFYETTPPLDPPNASIEISALIDGRDQLIIHDGTLQWEHFDAAAVGRHEGQNVPTTITTRSGDDVIMDHVEWTPEWSSPPPDNIRRHELSSVFDQLLPEFPRIEQDVSLAKLDVRGSASIVQQPSEANDYTLIVEFDDNRSGASDVYTLRLDYNDPLWQPVPLGSVGAVDIAAEFTHLGGRHGLGQLVASGQADVIVEDGDGVQTSHIGGSFEMTASLSADDSSDGLAVGRFTGGSLVFRDNDGQALLSGDFISLTLYEPGDDWGMLAGNGIFEVTGGSLQGKFVERYGDVFQMVFDISPGGIDDFSGSFSGLTNITVTPNPEPATMVMLALGAAAIAARKRRR